ncbi:MAG: hypothetical protein JOZ62_03655 [Acidobacteriaceae bacterium]|nr:hypothetical protein [Acidobacteriaceae bacterium]
MVKFSCIWAVVAVLAGAEDITPRVGPIEIYGIHKLSATKIRAALGVKEGDSLPSRNDAEQKLGQVSGVVAASVEAICCDAGRTILYIGIEEKNAPHMEFHSMPTQDISLPAAIVDKYNALLRATAESMRAGNADEDLTNGYSLMADPEARALQQGLLPLVDANLTGIDSVLRKSADPEQRAICAYVLQYGPRSERGANIISNGLQYALRDPDPDVRKSAMLALKAVMVGAKLHPEQQIRVEPTWFVELMNSIAWSDRRNASLALVTMTDGYAPEILAVLRDRALRSVVGMARWRHLEHALPGFILAGRVAGLDEKEIQTAWLSGDREQVLTSRSLTRALQLNRGSLSR